MITPGPHAKERKFAVTFVGAASVLFAGGAVLAYYVVPTGLSFLVNLGGGEFITALTGGAYIGFPADHARGLRPDLRVAAAGGDAQQGRRAALCEAETLIRENEREAKAPRLCEHFAKS